MNTTLHPYRQEEHLQGLRALIRKEGEEWKDYLQPAYEKALKNAITYVAMKDHILIGYLRAIEDNGIYLWIVDLLVDKAYRGHAMGKRLMDQLCQAYPHMETYVLSDADGYYEKLGFKKEGSIYRVS